VPESLRSLGWHRKWPNILSIVHTPYIGNDAKAGSGKKAKRAEIGVVWPCKNGQGLNLAIAQGLSVSGRIVCMPPKAGA
jgi:hypothetical protein